MASDLHFEFLELEDEVFPLFDLPDEAVERVLSSVDGLEDTRSARLVCKRARAIVDSRVEAVKGGRCHFEGRRW